MTLKKGFAFEKGSDASGLLVKTMVHLGCLPELMVYLNPSFMIYIIDFICFHVIRVDAS